MTVKNLGKNKKIILCKLILFRKRSRFPDPQWNCVKAGVTDIINYLCEQEISNSFKKYCIPLKEQINIIIETILFHDSLPTMCKRINMCFYSK